MKINESQSWLISSTLLLIFTTSNLLLVRGDGPSTLLVITHLNLQTPSQSPSSVSGLGFFEALADGLSLQEKLNSPLWTPSSEHSNVSTLPVDKNEEEELSCVHAEEDKKSLINVVAQAISYYETHIDQIKDSLIGLKVLSVGIQYHLKTTGENFAFAEVLNRINQLIDQAVTAGSESSNKNQNEIAALVKDQKNWKRYFFDWKCPSVINSRKVEFHTVGYEKETVWGLLNGQCQAALISRCDVPYACQRTFLDPEPQSQYMLTLQALYLILAKQKSCDQKHPEVFKDLETTLDRQCSKIYQEAELIAQNGFPLWARDLFSKQVAICGFAGYPNFIQRSWILELLSWQITTTELPKPPVSFTTLVIQLGYLFDKCSTPATQIQPATSRRFKR